MIGYTSVGTNDLARATAFYDALLAEIGAKRVMDMGRFIVYGSAMDQPMFSICTPYDNEPAHPGNGVMIALRAANPAQVDSLYARAMELGATDEGAPGARMDNFYAAYFRDLDGNKLNFYYMGPMSG